MPLNLVIKANTHTHTHTHTHIYIYKRERGERVVESEKERGSVNIFLAPLQKFILYHQ